MDTATTLVHARPAPDLGGAWTALARSARPLLWPAHLVPLLGPTLVPGLGGSAWAIGLLLWLGVGLGAAAARLGAAPRAVPVPLWTAWRVGLVLVALFATLAVGAWASAAMAAYAASVLAWSRRAGADAL